MQAPAPWKGTQVTMGMGMGDMAGAAAGGVATSLALFFFVGAYFFAVWDSRREGAEADGQIGIKLVLYTLCLGALGIAAGGVETLLHYMLSGAKTGTPQIKEGVAKIASGGLVLAGIVMTMLPRTNTEEHPKVFRLALGMVAGVAGTLAVLMFSGFVTSMIKGGGTWAAKSGTFAQLVTYGAIGYIALTRLGALSGWTAPARPVAPMPPAGGAGFPPQGGMPQGGGYPQGQQQPQAGGYPPQGQQMPQGGGYPPQGQQAPPQGGYPPQGGGGYPPQGGGGGYPPR